MYNNSFSIRSGAVSTAGMPLLICRILVKIERGGLTVNEIRSQYTYISSMLCSFTIHSPDKPCAIAGERIATIALGDVVLQKGDLVYLTVEGPLQGDNVGYVSAQRYESAGVSCVSDTGGSFSLNVHVYETRNIIGGNIEHHTVELLVSDSSCGDIISEGGPVVDFLIRTDQVGFVIMTRRGVRRLRSLLSSGQSPLEFLTTDVRADEFIKEGLYMPFLGLRSWPYRVAFFPDKSLTWPIGIEVERPRSQALCPQDEEIIVCFGAALLDIEALESLFWPVIPAPFTGRMRLRTFTSGASLVTFLLMPSDNDAEPDDAAVNIDPYSAWHEEIGERNAEPLWVG